ncbi:MAG: DUF433 domain-containing protein [Saprospiraceae bacterium]
MMTTLEKLSLEISALPPTQQRQLLSELVTNMNLAHVGINHTPGVCGGRACIRDTRIPVWMIIEAKQTGATDLMLLQDFPALTAEDLTNAQRYFAGHVAEIEQDLREQELEVR